MNGWRKAMIPQAFPIGDTPCRFAPARNPGSGTGGAWSPFGMAMPPGLPAP